MINDTLTKKATLKNDFSRSLIHEILANSLLQIEDYWVPKCLATDTTIPVSPKVTDN